MKKNLNRLKWAKGGKKGESETEKFILFFFLLAFDCLEKKHLT